MTKSNRPIPEIVIPNRFIEGRALDVEDVLIELGRMQERIETLLLSAGYVRGDVTPTQQVIGFTTACIRPGLGRWVVEVQHFDYPNVDPRPWIAKYASVLEAEGIDHMIEYIEPDYAAIEVLVAHAIPESLVDEARGILNKLGVE